jgi:ABC-type multidrug transport system ATPase subunit
VFVPQKGKKVRLSMGESSSAVRSLLDIGFYLRHIAKPGDMLMIDEPELNLHPENQRRIARLIARLINIGIKVFITTHSDYIIKELNTLIMLNQPDKEIQQIREAEGYKEDELISSDKIKVYMTKTDMVLLDGHKRKTKILTLVKADIDPVFGIEAETFDKTIDDMNRIQDAIIFCGS